MLKKDKRTKSASAQTKVKVSVLLSDAFEGVGQKGSQLAKFFILINFFGIMYILHPLPLI